MPDPVPDVRLSSIWCSSASIPADESGAVEMLDFAPKVERPPPPPPAK
jgi:hypothetical protein